MAGMLKIAKCLGVGFATAIFLWVCGQQRRENGALAVRLQCLEYKASTASA